MGFGRYRGNEISRAGQRADRQGEEMATYIQSGCESHPAGHISRGSSLGGRER